ncbi:serine hydrolase domain-containing protein [Rubinisphaera brasiliensis]|uniref:Beta-lactamase n=1 Tax=Rubinisphaera brasiliensis (strain ATCC 49424 / DSM 5305 / JCM 21570 / IAM 15109 / NBRC 103401 / IFAM 1448) TaxID=756272 RepID=F0SJH9_RUBBR|nr:serine hydrolase domain-containing protein [Rubinisphaera brasiliensis]ADY60791.1 beta-lactamase [Rubinisphaera brasiliensis DSM 5305]
MKSLLAFALAISVLAPLNLSTAAELPAAKPAEVGLSAEKLNEVSKIMQQRVADEKLAGGVVAIARKGKLVYLEAFGDRDVENDLPMETDSIVRIYSMTKAIATAAALMLVDEGKLDPEAPASRYVPALADVQVWTEDGLVAPNRPITVADLMRHTAGFGNSGHPGVGKDFQQAKLQDATSLDDYVSRLASVPLAYQPGEDWIYSNSIDVLGLVIQNASGQPFDEFLQDRILNPLGMNDTGFFVPENKRERFATLYNRDQDGLKPNDSPQANDRYYSKPAVPSGGGGLVGTAEDYMQFLMMIANGGEWAGKRYLKPETVKLMTTNQLPKAAYPIYFGKQVRHGIGYSFGFNVRVEASDDWDPAAPVGELGWGGAASTHYWVSPKDEVIVVTLEQVRPYNFETEWAIKPIVYDAITE